jgi:4-hydroxy-tetrahydrodipicolinate reductase
MGRLVVELLRADPSWELVAEVGRGAVGPGCFGRAAVVVDFSSPEALRGALPALGERALVSGTTGLPADLEEALEAQAARGPVLWAANFSVGIALLRELVARAAAALPEADVEIVEAHHRRKRDAPSGTALALVRSAARSGAAIHGRSGLVGPRPAGEVGVHAVRGGGVVGDHDVHFLMEEEAVTLSHRALSRAAFARGAVVAARFVAGRPPRRYAFAEVLGGTPGAPAE